MKILHHRPTRRFVALLIQCRCGRKFLHRLDRPVVSCLSCGRTDEMRAVITRFRLAAATTRTSLGRVARRGRVQAA